MFSDYLDRSEHRLNWKQTNHRLAARERRYQTGTDMENFYSQFQFQVGMLSSSFLGQNRPAGILPKNDGRDWNYLYQNNS